MAILKELPFTGPLGELSAYHMRGVEGIVLRRKGGASKKMIKTSPRFELPRRNMSEFAGCAKIGKHVRDMMMPIRSLADYNISGPILKRMKVIQVQDTVSELGQRSILLSKHPRLLEGFTLNKHNPFDSIVRSTLSFSLERETHSARIEIPALMRDINFFPQNKHPLFSITISLGIVPDFVFNEATRKFQAPAWYKTSFNAAAASTSWFSALEGSPATTLEVALDKIPKDESYSLMLSIGIRFGTLYEGGLVKQVKRIGAAKILALHGGRTFTPFAPEGKDPEPVEEVIPSYPQDLKDNDGGSNGIQNTNTSKGLHYIYTLKQEHDSAENDKVPVYTYTISADCGLHRLEDDIDDRSYGIRQEQYQHTALIQPAALALRDVRDNCPDHELYRLEDYRGVERLTATGVFAYKRLRYTEYLCYTGFHIPTLYIAPDHVSLLLSGSHVFKPWSSLESWGNCGQRSRSM